jgi:hypothetical protein
MLGPNYRDVIPVCRGFTRNDHYFIFRSQFSNAYSLTLGQKHESAPTEED